jgi:hypothetical protein
MTDIFIGLGLMRWRTGVEKYDWTKENGNKQGKKDSAKPIYSGSSLCSRVLFSGFRKGTFPMRVL